MRLESRSEKPAGTLPRHPAGGARMLGWVVAAWLCGLAAWEGRAQSTAFTYQGRLAAQGQPAGGPHDFEFLLCREFSNGTVLGTNVIPAVPVSNGVFTVVLDFGAATTGAFQRFLEIHVKPSGATNPFAELTPRVALTPAPFALLAGGVVDGAVSSAKLADGAVTAIKLAPAAVGSGQLATDAVTTAKILDGAVTEPKLADGAVSTAKIQNGAVNSGKIAAGAVGASQIAAGAVNSAKIADGSILGDDIANGAITGAKLAPGAVRHVEAGRIARTNSFANLGFDVVLNSPFSNTPFIWTQTGPPGEVSITNKSAAGFSGVVDKPESLITNLIGGQYVGGFGVVNGEPAAALAEVTEIVTGAQTNGYDFWLALRPVHKLFYRRSASANFTFINPVLVVSNGTSTNYQVYTNSNPFQSLMESNAIQSVDVGSVGGFPVVAWHEWTRFYRYQAFGNPAASTNAVLDGRVRFCRALDANGTQWGAPVTVASNVKAVSGLKLLELGGVPALAFFDLSNRVAWFTRATSSSGATWNVPSSLFGNGHFGSLHGFEIINGAPAALFSDGETGDLRFVRALDFAGSAWASPVIVETNMPHGPIPSAIAYLWASLALVSGTPACVWFDQEGHVRWTRCTDPTGGNWSAAARSTILTRPAATVSLRVIGGHPAICAANSGMNSHFSLYQEAVDADGVNWLPPTELTAGFMPSLIDYAGSPAVFQISYNDPGFIFIRPGPNPPTLEWMAVEP